MPMIDYRCPDCGRDDERFYHSRGAALASIECTGFKQSAPRYEEIEREVPQPDGTVLIEKERVELAPALEPCTGTALQRVSLPGELWARPARGFADITVLTYPDWDSRSDDFKRSHERYYVPGRNYEREPGMQPVVMNSMADYNRFIKKANEDITSRMRDHRYMHEEYWKQRRKALREDVNARIGPSRSHPLVAFLRRAMQARSDRKSAWRYGKPLDAHFHSALLEFNQGNLQDFCAEDTGWKSQRAK